MKQIDFGSGKVGKNIALTAFPMLIAQMLNLLYSIVDRIYIGRIPGEGTMALGAAGLCFPVILLIAAFTNMYGMGGSPLFAMELGKGNAEKAEKVMNTSFRLLVITGILITVLGEIFCVPLLQAFGAADTSLPYAVPYMRIYLVGTILSMVTTGMNPFINAQGYPGIGMMTVVIGAVTNLILDPVFIFFFHMGVSGAAIATVISQGISGMFVLYYILGRKLIHRVTLRVKRGEESFFPYAGEIMALGTAPFIMQCTNSLVQIVCNNVLMKFGGELYVSIMTIITSVRQILDTPVGAIGEGASPVVSFNFGAGKADNVRKAITIMTGIGVAYTAVIWILIQCCPQAFITIFTPDKKLIEDTVPLLHLYFLAFVFQALQYSGQTVFKALGKKKQAVFFSLFRKVILVVPLTLLLPHLFALGIRGVFIAEPISNFIGGCFCFFTMLVIVLPELRDMEKQSCRSSSGGE